VKIFGVNIKYDEKKTLQLKENFKSELSPDKIRRLRAYELTDEFDCFRKYRCAFGFWDILKIHFQKVIDYWFVWRFKYFDTGKSI